MAKLQPGEFVAVDVGDVRAVADTLAVPIAQAIRTHGKRAVFAALLLAESEAWIAHEMTGPEIEALSYVASRAQNAAKPPHGRVS